MLYSTKYISWKSRKNVCNGVLLLLLGALSPTAFAQSFGPVIIYSVGANSQPQAVAVGDVNGDGRLDIVSCNANSNTATVLLGQVGGSFAPASNYSTGVNSLPSDVVLGDINGDGRLDIATANFASSTVGVLLGLAAGGFGPVTTYTMGSNTNPNGLALGDVNGDGRLDLVTANATTSTAGVRLGLAGGGFAPATSYSTGTNTEPSAVVLGDVNRDGRLDIVVNNFYTYETGVFLGQVNGFAPVTNYGSSANGLTLDIALADMNGDNLLDIITVSPYGEAVRVLPGLAAGGFLITNFNPFFTGTGTAPKGLVIGDVNGDGRPDIITANSGNSTAGLLLGLNGGLFAASTTYSTGPGSGTLGVALGDFNGDGRPDLVTANPTANSIGVLFNTGLFVPTTASRPISRDVNVFPNPAHGRLTVQLPVTFGSVQVNLINALGQVVHCATGTGPQFTIETDGLTTGIYTLRLQSNRTSLTKCVVLE